MGEVWLAHDETHSENVALKLLSIDMAKDASALEDLQREVIKPPHSNTEISSI